MPIYQKIKYRVLKKVKWELDPEEIPFYIEDAGGQGGEFTFNPINSSDTTNIEYSLDMSTWTSTKPSLPANGKVYIRANSTRCSGYPNPALDANVNFNVGGNIMSLYFGSNFTGQETAWPTNNRYPNDCFFYNCQHIISAENLILPARNLVGADYERYFQNSTLQKAPKELPATNLANSSYGFMFTGCSGVNRIKVLAQGYWPGFNSWVSGVAANGTFIKPSGTTIPTGVNGIPSDWTVVDA